MNSNPRSSTILTLRILATIARAEINRSRTVLIGRDDFFQVALFDHTFFSGAPAGTPFPGSDVQLAALCASEGLTWEYSEDRENIRLMNDPTRMQGPN